LELIMAKQQPVRRSLLIAGLLAFSGAVRAADAPLDLNSLDERLKIAEHKLELGADASAAKPTDATVSAGPSGFVINSADKTWSLKLSGLLQADSRVFFEDQLRPQANNILPRRARFQVDAGLGSKAKLRFQTDLATGLLVDAYGELKLLPWATLRTGLFKTPLSLERWRSDPARDFVEMGYTTDLVTDRDTGAYLELADADQVISLGVGVFNGSVDSTAAIITDTDDDKDVVAKLFTHPFRALGVASLRDFGFGIAASGGNRAAGTTPSGANQFRPTGQGAGFFSLSNTATVEDANLRVVPQAYLFWHGLSVLTEYVRASQDTKNPFNTKFPKKALVTHEAYQVQLGYVLTGEDAAFTGLKLNKESGAWGALQVLGRYQGLNFDQEAFNRYDGSPAAATSSRFVNPRTSPSSAKAWGLALNYVPLNNVKLQLNWEETAFTDGASKGTGINTVTTNRETEKVLLTRFQYCF
jgi:phosphate-selective porin OprO/OprP